MTNGESNREPTQVEKFIGRGLSLFLALAVALPIFLAGYYLALIALAYFLPVLGVSENDLLDHMPWLQAVCVIGGIYSCWVVYLLVKKYGSNRAV
jgi:hypothetical protein